MKFSTILTEGKDKKVKLTPQDKKILSILMKDARVPYLEVARICRVSGAAVHLLGLLGRVNGRGVQRR